ncbi:unnamed protein product [Phyllotreta striolata]|uniref:Uncharacterized protein n=1 Tax=Phyllotreta striolata TaxID=444603 RepID=A0A9N9XJN6_PHYSR|nr:unnamed protein product [Phyllotreta striolata]
MAMAKKRLNFKLEEIETEPKIEPTSESFEYPPKITFDYIKNRHSQRFSIPSPRSKSPEAFSPREFEPATLKRIRLFDYRQTHFKKKFRNSSLFKWNCKDPYAKIDQFFRTLKKLEDEEKRLLKKVNLGELHFPESLPLKVVGREIRQIKVLWDFITIVKNYLYQLKRIEWDDNALDQLEEQLLHFKKELNGLSDVKGCDAFVQAMSNINQVVNCIYTVSDLDNTVLGSAVWKETVIGEKKEETL